MSAEVTLLVRIGCDLIIPKYQPTKRSLETDAIEEEEEEEEDEEEEEQNDEENKEEGGGII
jgi:hypothetical protein